MRVLGRASILTLLAVGLLTAPASADPAPLHGISFLAGCDGPTYVGDVVPCSVTIANTRDADTLTITAIVEVVHRVSGDLPSADILPSLQLTLSGGATCDDEQTTCTLPPGARIDTVPGTGTHVAAPADAGYFSNTTTLIWHSLCTSGTDNCPSGDQQAMSGSGATVVRRPSSVDAVIHDADHNEVTAVDQGTPVHESVTVSGPPDGPTPHGSVTIDFFKNDSCTGDPAATSGRIALDNGAADAGFVRSPRNPGEYAFVAHYSGDQRFMPSDGDCVSFTVG
jgi:hypothetical protein